MKKMMILFILLVSNLQAAEMLARVTYYWGCTQTSTGNKPICGKTIAVDPKIIPYGSKVIIPKMGKIFMAHDTGSAVKSKLASRKLGKPNVIVVDVFCKSKSEAQRRIKKYPMFMTIKIEKN